MLRHLFLIVPFLLLVPVTSAVALPPCPSSDDTKWHNCEGTYTWPTGDKYVGEFRDGEKLGQGTHTFATGNKYVGEFRNNLFHGQGTFTFADEYKNQILGRPAAGLAVVGEMVDHYANGNVTLYWGNGDVWVGRMRISEDNPEGTWLGGNKYTAGNVPPEVYAATGRDAPPSSKNKPPQQSSPLTMQMPSYCRMYT